MSNNQNHPQNGSTGFNYTYSAKEQTELRRIREKYLADTKPSELDKMEQIRRLDTAVTQKATTVALVIGIIGTLLMGFGMSLILTDLKEILSTYRNLSLILGIFIGFIGMLGVIGAYPLYQRIASRERKKIAPEILRLTDELMNERK